MNGTRSWMPVCAVLALAAVVAGASNLPFAAAGSRGREVRTQPAGTDTMTGAQLRQRLEERVPGVSWKAAPLYVVLDQLSEGFGIALLRDRRIDPTTNIDLQAANQSLKDLLGDVVTPAGGEISITGNVVYLGPPNAATIVRTSAELRRQELTAPSGKGLSARRVELQRGRTIRWGDLTTPAEVLDLVAEEWDLRIENKTLVPHDLWAGGQFPKMSAAEMLTLVLIQFDLTFTWGADLQSVRLVPLPADRSAIVIERSYTPPRSVGSMLGEWKEKVGDFDATVARDRLVVRGTVEQHEFIDRAISGRGAEPGKAANARPEVAPLERRLFTLTIARVPASSIMARLEESGVTFQYDPQALSAAGIDLATPVGLDVTQVDAATFFKAIFDPLRLKADIEGTTVRLSPLD